MTVSVGMSVKTSVGVSVDMRVVVAMGVIGVTVRVWLMSLRY